MTRKIKFRVWDKDLAKYLEGCEIDSLMAELSAKDDGRVVIIKQICPARYIFEQYTGLKDKNDKEICEGDIVRVALFTRNGDRDRYKKAGIEEIGYIGFEEGSFKICFTKNKFGEPTSYLRLDDLHWETHGEVLGKTNWYKYDPEIIGNIHENPGLLKEGGKNGKSKV